MKLLVCCKNKSWIARFVLDSIDQAVRLGLGLGLGLCLGLSSCDRGAVAFPTAFGVCPSPVQVEWQKMEYYMFVHFGPNTFTDVEWGDGKEDPKVFAPTDLDCRQWAATAKSAGMKGIILTVKHHDGFCLWPSKFSTHTVRESGWKDGKGDVVQELSEACREYGLKMGVYLSPWDRNHPAYNTPEYNQVFASTLGEVLSSYGEVFEQWFDGAGDGSEESKSKYDWALFHKTVYANQPNAVIFSDVGPGCRWIGNERGIAGETNWSRLDTDGFTPGRYAPPTDTLNQGNKYGKYWVPGEVDVSIRPGWFYSSSTDDKVKSVEDLMRIYLQSVGRNANLLLNVPPDRSGRINPIDSTRLMEFASEREQMFAENLLKDAKLRAECRGTSRKDKKLYSPYNLSDGNFDTFWASDDQELRVSVDIELSKCKIINTIVLQEYIPLGQRVEQFKIFRMDDSRENRNDSWIEIASGTTIGYKRILQFLDVNTRKVRVEFYSSLASPIISNMELYHSPIIF